MVQAQITEFDSKCEKLARLQLQLLITTDMFQGNQMEQFQVLEIKTHHLLMFQAILEVTTADLFQDNLHFLVAQVSAQRLKSCIKHPAVTAE
jgi:hypothetical protein